MTSIGENIKYARMRWFMTQADLGKQIDRGVSIINQYETNRRPVPLEVAIKIADTCEVGLKDILGDTEIVRTLERLMRPQWHYRKNQMPKPYRYCICIFEDGAKDAKRIGFVDSTLEWYGADMQLMRIRPTKWRYLDME